MSSSAVSSSAAPSSTSAAAFSDPHFRGFWGQSFYVGGAVGGVYSLLTSPHMQLNARFVYLRNISCPVVEGRDVSNCFQEQGTFFGSMALRVQGGHWLRVVGGAVQDGFASVQLHDGRTVEVGESISVGAAGAASTSSPSPSPQLSRLQRLTRGQADLPTTVTTASSEAVQAGGVLSADASSSSSTAPTLTVSVSRPSHRQLILHAGDYTLSIDNMDSYVDITQLDVQCWLCLEQGSMQLDGLLGQTWNASAVIKQSDDEVEEYRLQGDDLLGCKHAHDRFCHAPLLQ